jgi:hypothetical protein
MDTTISITTYRGFKVTVFQTQEDPTPGGLVWFDYFITRKKGKWWAPTCYHTIESALEDAKEDIDQIIKGPRRTMSVRAYKKHYPEWGH